MLIPDCNGEAVEHGGEALPTGGHGLGAGWLVVAVPAAEPGNHPCEPGERAFAVSVLLPLGLAFECDGDGRHRFDQGLLDDIGGRPRAAVPRIGELDDAGACLERQGRELEQPVGGLRSEERRVGKECRL